jgi:hypothetical protein
VECLERNVRQSIYLGLERIRRRRWTVEIL